MSIVPSTGLLTFEYASSLAERSAAAIVFRSTCSASPRTPAAPRTSTDRMTPEFPRPPSSAAPRDQAGEGGAVRARVAVTFERLHDRANRERQIRAGVTVRHRVDVQVVDPAAVALERAQRCA